MAWRTGASVVVLRGSFTGMHGTVVKSDESGTLVELWLLQKELPFMASDLALTAARRATFPRERASNAADD
jgi:hypothetical protein